MTAAALPEAEPASEVRPRNSCHAENHMRRRGQLLWKERYNAVLGCAEGGDGALGPRGPDTWRRAARVARDPPLRAPDAGRPVCGLARQRTANRASGCGRERATLCHTAAMGARNG